MFLTRDENIRQRVIEAYTCAPGYCTAVSKETKGEFAVLE